MNRSHLILEWGGTCERVVADAATQELSAWLHPAELELLAELIGQRRRSAWLGGRWCVKQLVRQWLTSNGQSDFEPVDSLREIAVMSRNWAGRAVRPIVYVRGVAQAWAATITHSDRQIYAAIDTRPRASLGIDVVDRAGKWDAIAATWFTAREQSWLASHRDPFAALRIWSAKEACYKAISPRQPFDPRTIAVEVIDDAQGFARFTHESQTLPIRWRETELGIHALASSADDGATLFGAKR